MGCVGVKEMGNIGEDSKRVGGKGKDAKRKE
jgi:hypothetical protein